MQLYFYFCTFLYPIPTKQREESKVPEQKNAPRLSQELTEEQRRKLNELIPWGYRTPVFSAIIDNLIEILEGEDRATRKAFLGALVSEKVTLFGTQRNKKDG